MGKKMKADKADADKQPTFEQALEKLEQIAAELEEGELGLSDALVRYEEGVKHLKQCYQLLRKAERKIELLAGVDAQGNPRTEPFDEQEMSLSEKAQSRSRRRSRPAAKSSPGDKKTDDDDDVDVPPSLF